MQTPATSTKLTQKQLDFCSYYIATGGKIGKAAQAAGYASSNEGSRLLANPLIVQHIQELVRTELGAAVVPALHTVRRLATAARSEYVRLQAAQDLLDRGGFKASETHLHMVRGAINISFDVAPNESGLVKVVEIDQSTLPPEQGGG